MCLPFCSLILEYIGLSLEAQLLEDKTLKLIAILYKSVLDSLISRVKLLSAFITIEFHIIEVSLFSGVKPIQYIVKQTVVLSRRLSVTVGQKK